MEGGGMPPQILSLSAEWRLVFSLATSMVYIRKTTLHAIGQEAGWTRERVSNLVDCPYQESNTDFPVVQPIVLSLY
jgi:hypothetical protein